MKLAIGARTIQLLCGLFLIGLLAGATSLRGDYISPFWLGLPYDSAHTSLSADERTQLATALADFARSIPSTTPDSETLRSKAIALALRLDSENKGAVIGNAQFKRGNFTPPAGPSISKDDLTKMFLLEVKKMQGQTDGPDKWFAAYVLDFLAAIDPGNEDLTYQAELAQQKTPVQWAVVFHTAPAPAATAMTPAVPPQVPGHPSDSPLKPVIAPPTSSGAAAAPTSLKKQQSKVNGLAVLRSDDNELGGKVMEVLVTASSVEPSAITTCDFATDKISDTTKISKDEAFRAVEMRHPEFNKGLKFTLSFDDKYMNTDGGSAATAYAVSMLSILENVNIDSACALTGDITVDGKVRKVGGVPSKISGAKLDGCKYVGIPEDNSEDVGNLMVMESYRSIAGIQIFSLSTLDDALALARSDRAQNISSAMSAFAEVQAMLDKGGTLGNPQVAAKLDEILKLAPNHLSARFLSDKIKGVAPTALTPGTALNEVFEAASPVFSFSRALSREDERKLGYRSYYTISLRKQVYSNVQKQLQLLEKKVPPQVQNTYYAIVNLSNAVEFFDEEYHGVPHRTTLKMYLIDHPNDPTRMSRLDDINKCYETMVAEITKLEYDKKFIESQIR